MNYYKKVCVLKEINDSFAFGGKPIGGLIRLEIDEGVAIVFLSVVNLAVSGGGDYVLFLSDGNKTLCDVKLGLRPTAVTKVLPLPPDVSKGFAAGIFYVKDGIPELVTFARSEECAVTYTDLKKAVAEKCLETYKAKPQQTVAVETQSNDAEQLNQTPVNAPFFAETVSAPPLITAADVEKAQPLPDGEVCATAPYGEEDFPLKKIVDAYDDEAVATENYFASDAFDNINKVVTPNEYLSDKTAQFDSGEQTQEEEGEIRLDGVPYETDGDGREKYSETNPYYQSVKEELEQMLNKFPREDALLSVFPDSSWVRINYSDDKYYVVGVVKEMGKEKYICYGVPSEYSENPPEELKGFCSFIPLSVFSVKGDGYFMMFQDAVTGECIKMKEN